MEEFNWYSIEPKVDELNRGIRRDIEDRLEYALRHLVAPPIKGEITRGKIRWRGISMTHIIIDDGDVFQSGIAEDGKLKEPIFTGRTFATQFRWKVNLMQRGKEIPLTFGEEGEEKYLEWLTIRNLKRK